MQPENSCRLMWCTSDSGTQYCAFEEGTSGMTIHEIRHGVANAIYDEFSNIVSPTELNGHRICYPVATVSSTQADSVDIG